MDNIRDNFPILDQCINNNTLIYLDNAATNQKPNSVINSISNYYQTCNANIDRGWHTLGSKVANLIELARENTANFVNAKSESEIIFTSGTTESVNLIASTYGNYHVKEGDSILISQLEHHSNIVPWLELCKRKNAFLKVIPINLDGDINMEQLDKLLKLKPKLIAITLVSNTLGTITPIKEIIKKAHKHGTKVFVDAAQAAPHINIDVSDINCDFLAFSSHKLYGPTGVGVLYVKHSILKDLPPYKYGGGIIEEASFEKAIYIDIPNKFEAGTINIAGIIGFSKAIEFIISTGKHKIYNHEEKLLNYTIDILSGIQQVKIIGNPNKRCGLVSFVVENIHHLDVGMIFDSKGIIVRTGHHCTQPLMNVLGLDGTIRVSFAVYNTIKEIDKMIDTLRLVIKKSHKKCLV